VLLREMQIQNPTAVMIARTAVAQDDISGWVYALWRSQHGNSCSCARRADPLPARVWLNPLLCSAVLVSAARGLGVVRMAAVAALVIDSVGQCRWRARV